MPVTSEADCLAAEPPGNWVAAATICFVGGNAAPQANGGLTKADDCPDLPDEFFFDGVQFLADSTDLWDLCAIPLHRLAPTVVSAAASAGTVQNLATTSADLAPDLPDGSSTVPAADVLPYGLIGFTITGIQPGAEVDVTLQLSPLPVGAAAPTEYWKLQNNEWSKLEGAVVTATSATITLQDGGIGDADGEANGVIVDPGGPVVGPLVGPLTAGSRGLVRPVTTPACVETARVQNDAAAADLGVGDSFHGSDDNVRYHIVSDAPGCNFNCTDGFDANCDGQLGDACPVEFDVSRVQGVAQCLAFFDTAPPVAAAPAAPVQSASVQSASASSGGELAHTGGETDPLRDLGLAVLGLGASVLALRGTLHRRRD